MRLIGRIILWLFAVVGMAAVLVSAVGIVVAVFYSERAPDLPDRMVLRLDLNGGIADGRSGDPWDSLLDLEVLTLHDAVSALGRAARDDRVAGVAVQLGDAGIGIATAQELRQAFAAFRGSGKFVTGFATSFGGPGSVMSQYMLAASFDDIWMQPSGTLALTGIALELPFVRETLDMVGVEPEFEQRHEYKSFMETFTRSGFSLPARRSLEQLVQGWMGQILGSIAEDRRIPPDRLRALVDRAPLLAGDARENGLIDTLGYRDEFRAALRERAGDGSHFIDLMDYAASIEAPAGDMVDVALIYGTGPVVEGSGEDDVLGEQQFSAAAVAATIVAAANDPDIRAIVLRIDSPGGSYVASDTVRRAVLLAREKGRTVIASMGSVAASGGYFAAMGADRIVAQPGTVTGSIGVFGGKFATEQLWKKLGVNWERVSVGANAGMWSSIRPFSPSEAQRHAAILDAIYGDFTQKAAADRNIPADRIDAVARGRVWTGADARDVGLVDDLGGLTTALELVRTNLGLADETTLNLVILPEKPSPLQHLRKLLGRSGPFSRILAGLVRVLRVDSYRSALRGIAPVVRELEALRPPAGVLQLPPLRGAP